MLRWFDNQRDFLSAVRLFDDYRQAVEAWIAARDTIAAWCDACERVTELLVACGGHYGEQPNLREGLRCAGCGLSNRNRLLYHAIVQACADRPDSVIAILERFTPLFERLHTQFPSIIGSEYFGDDKEPGSNHVLQGHPVRHESITELSFPDASLDVLAHGDVFEHVFEFRLALREAARVLRPDGGVMLFTVPFFMTRDRELELARPKPDGSIQFHSPPEYHGDTLRPEGILTWHHFGWSLLDDIREAGFRSVQVGLDFDPFRGLTSNNHPNFDYGLMHPVLLRAQR